MRKTTKIKIKALNIASLANVCELLLDGLLDQTGFAKNMLKNAVFRLNIFVYI